MAPATGQFDIYQSAVGVTAVASPVQRQILRALADRDMQLPEIVELTGKAKSTLSSIHMKELRNRELVEELPHPTDNRRKVYHLTGRPLKVVKGKGEAVPVAGTPSPRASRPAPAEGPGISLAAMFRVLAAAPEGADDVLQEQARELGRQVATRLAGANVREFAASLTRFVEEERLAEHLQLDFEKMTFRCRPGVAVSEVSAPRMGMLLAMVAQEAAAALGLDGVAFDSTAKDGVFQLAPVRS